jgi:ornithine carbamoyltransferase
MSDARENMENTQNDTDRRIAHAETRLRARDTQQPRRDSFLAVDQLSLEELHLLLDLGLRLKADRGMAVKALKGQSIALLFQKTSTRTRCSFEIGAGELGAQPMYIDWRTSNFTLGDIGDEIKVLSRYVTSILARVFKHEDLLIMDRHSEVPIVNGLSDYNHPCQGLADLMTLKEYFGELTGLLMAYVGDGNNMCNTLIECARKARFRLQLSLPRGYGPNQTLLALGLADGTITLFETPAEAVRGADVLYTDTWISMGEEEEATQRLHDFRGFGITKALTDVAPKHALIMHCLPAHRGQEISSDVIDSRRSIVFDQAENRKHIQKSLLLWLYGVSTYF